MKTRLTFFALVVLHLVYDSHYPAYTTLLSIKCFHRNALLDLSMELHKTRWVICGFLPMELA